MLQEHPRILLAEDDYSLALMMKDTLEEEGYAVVYCRDGKEAIENYSREGIDICLLDIMMPHRDGYAVAKKIRQQSDLVPILFISTKGQEEDRLKGYQGGADDYIAKPFSMQELLMKIEVFLRRTKKMHSEIPVGFHLGSLYFSYTMLQLQGSGLSADLTQKEADLLRFLCEHPNRILKRQEVLLNVWGKEDFFLGRSMDVYITKLRKLLKPEPLIVIETVHGIGYRFTLPPEIHDGTLS